MARLRLREEDLLQRVVDPAKAYDPIPYVIESESILFDDLDVGCRMIEALLLPQDRQAMCFGEESVEELAQKFSQSIAMVSLYYFSSL